MFFFWLILLAVVYMVIAIVVGKMCAINSQWETTVDHVDSVKVNRSELLSATGTDPGVIGNPECKTE